VAEAAGEVLFGRSVLIGTSPDVEMVVRPAEGGIGRVAGVVAWNWIRGGWTTTVVTGTYALTITGQLDGVRYTAHLEACSKARMVCEMTGADEDDVYVRVWRSG
jgi:hypothetical protein